MEAPFFCLSLKLFHFLKTEDFLFLIVGILLYSEYSLPYSELTLTIEIDEENQVPTVTIAAINEAEEFKSSLQYDFNKHKPLELDDILGTVVRQAEKKGIPTPASTTLMCILEKYKEG